jgi:hypothetical protein
MFVAVRNSGRKSGNQLSGKSANFYVFLKVQIINYVESCPLFILELVKETSTPAKKIFYFYFFRLLWWGRGGFGAVNASGRQ